MKLSLLTLTLLACSLNTLGMYHNDHEAYKVEASRQAQPNNPPTYRHFIIAKSVATFVKPAQNVPTEKLEEDYYGDAQALKYKEQINAR